MTFGRFFGFLLFAVVMIAVGFGGSLWYQQRGERRESSETTSALPAPLDSAAIEAQGRLEPANKTIAVSALPGEQLVSIEVEVGQAVTAGQELAVLGSRDVREAEYELAMAQKEKGEAQYRSELELSRERIEVARLAVELAQARGKEIPSDELEKILVDRKQLAEDQLKKLRELRLNPATRDAVTDAEIEQQQLLTRQLDVEIQQSAAKRAAALEAQRLAVEAASKEVTITEKAQAGLIAAKPEQVLYWTAELADRTRRALPVKAPCDGHILEIYCREGERIANTPILLMADLKEMVCVAEVHEARLKEIETDQVDGKLIPTRRYPVTIKSLALEQDLKGEVQEVGRLIGAPKLRDPNPLARSDLRTAQVIIKLDEASTKLAQRFVHLQVNVTIELE
jgi:ABC exporter DevB family membrane fusion protein